jgi:hypothetical protein
MGRATCFVTCVAFYSNPMHPAQHPKTDNAVPVPGAPRLAPIPLPLMPAVVLADPIITPPSTPTDDAMEMEAREEEEVKPHGKKKRLGEKKETVRISFFLVNF